MYKFQDSQRKAKICEQLAASLHTNNVLVYKFNTNLLHNGFYLLIVQRVGVVEFIQGDQEVSVHLVIRIQKAGVQRLHGIWYTVHGNKLKNIYFIN